ncbi:MAG TPA: hypothetical protein VGB55_06625, partial [Tepidisphaeraceae bacterium]
MGLGAISYSPEQSPWPKRLRRIGFWFGLLLLIAAALWAFTPKHEIAYLRTYFGEYQPFGWSSGPLLADNLSSRRIGWLSRRNPKAMVHLIHARGYRDGDLFELAKRAEQGKVGGDPSEIYQLFRLWKARTKRPESGLEFVAWRGTDRHRATRIAFWSMFHAAETNQERRKILNDFLKLEL